MDILLQVLFGSFTGWMLSKAWSDWRQDVALGVIGAMAGSLLMNAFGLPGVSGYNLYSFMVAMSGAVAVILTGRWLVYLPQSYLK